MPSRQERRKVSAAVDLGLDLDQRVQDHRPAFGEIDLEGVDVRVLLLVRVVAIDLERARLLGPRLGLVDRAGLDPRVLRAARIRPCIASSSAAGSVDALGRRHGLDLVGQRVQCAPAGRRWLAAWRSSIQTTVCFIQLTSSRSGIVLARMRAAAFGAVARRLHRRHRLEHQVLQLQRLDDVAVPDLGAVVDPQLAQAVGDVRDLAGSLRSSIGPSRNTEA